MGCAKDVKGRSNSFSGLFDVRVPETSSLKLGDYLSELGQAYSNLYVEDKLAKRTPIGGEIRGGLYSKAVYLCVPRSRNKVLIPKQLTGDYAYLLGALRDCTAYAREYEIKFTQASKRWLLRSVASRLDVVFGVTKFGLTYRRDSRTYALKINSKALFSILVSHARIDLKPNPTPPIVKDSPFGVQRWYMTGFYDAEGDKSLTRIRMWQSWPHPSNCPPLDDIKDMLERQRIRSGVVKVGRGVSGLYEFSLEVYAIPRGNKEEFMNLIPLEHPHISLRGPRKFRRA